MKQLKLWLTSLLCVVAFTTANTAHAADGSHPGMVVAAHPLAAEAGRDILAAGGSAVDAAIAIQAVLTLVEPQSSGIGGGAFLLFYDAKTGKTHAYDGRETAPAAATEDMFLGGDGRPLPFFEAALGGRAVGVPGVVAMLEMAHNNHGNLAWADLFDDAIRHAEDGFAITPRYHAVVSRMAGVLNQIPPTAAYFMAEYGTPLPAGHVLQNADYAHTLRLIADGGAKAFYTGPIAQAIVDAVQDPTHNPGRLTMADMANFTATERDALCRPYRSHDVCTMPPPTSGGLTVLQILGLMERFNLKDMDPSGATLIHLTAEANRLAYADRAVYIADPDFVTVPVEGMLDRDYLRARSQLISMDRAMETVTAGTPPGSQMHPEAQATEPQHTTHFSIVDNDGNVLAMTSSVQIPFGSSVMAAGFLLNNQLTDFEYIPRRDGRPVANRPQGGKRPRSSMSPTIVFDAQDRPAVVIGSPGGARIIGYVAQSLVALLDNGLSIQDAVALPHYGAPRNALTLEADTPITALQGELEAMGHMVEVRDMNSGLHGIAFSYEGDTVTLSGGADPRREGVALSTP